MRVMNADLHCHSTASDGLLPPAEPGSATLAQYRRFAALVAQAPMFAIPAHRAPWTAAHADLDRHRFGDWLSAQGLDDPALRWYLDYCCRDDYGAGLDTVSAWAGVVRRSTSGCSGDKTI